MDIMWMGMESGDNLFLNRRRTMAEAKKVYIEVFFKLDLDVRCSCLRTDEDITVCTEFTLEGKKESIRRNTMIPNF